MEGPYRDLGGGFVRLTGTEGARRSPSRINTVEDALHELLRNSLDAGARNIHVATTLRRRRYRTLTVIDDGCGIPEQFRDLIFEPGVTGRHLDSTPNHGAGLSLYHLKNLALSAELLSRSSPTSIQATFDTKTLPERSLQSDSRPSKTNLLATIQNFLTQLPPENRPNIYLGPPSRILTNLIDLSDATTPKENHIIQKRRVSFSFEDGSFYKDGDSDKNRGEVSVAQAVGWEAGRVGLDVSVRTMQRILAGKISGVKRVEVLRKDADQGLFEKKAGDFEAVVALPTLEEISGIRTILEGAARARYLEVGEIELKAERGAWVIRVPVYEPEEEYE